MSKIRTADLRDALADSPSTANELALVLGMTKRNVNVGLWVLQTTGQVTSLRSIRNTEAYRANKRMRRYLKLYELTPHGLAMWRKETSNGNL
jgi:hypothetical protein